MESPGSFFFSSFFLKKNKKKLEGQWTSFFFRVRPLEERTICAASWAAVERVAAVRQPIVSVSHRLAHRWQCFPVAITTTFWPKKKKLLLLTTEWLDLVQMRIPKLWKKGQNCFALKPPREISENVFIEFFIWRGGFPLNGCDPGDIIRLLACGKRWKCLDRYAWPAD